MSFIYSLFVYITSCLYLLFIFYLHGHLLIIIIIFFLMICLCLDEILGRLFYSL
ncbi:hypothetical protein BZA77DRAFT_305537 [Pyronema omphalodes]|nr:hypothetical protein BZA77DRAFT_305537 [Pyronema omphalodes]